MGDSFGKPNHSEKHALINYLETMSGDLARLACGHGLDALGYLFELARLEAENVSRVYNARNSGR